MRRVQRPVFKYATTRTAQLRRWWTDLPLSPYILFHYSWGQKIAKKNASIFSDFWLYPYFAHSLFLLPQRWGAIFAAVRWWTDPPLSPYSSIYSLFMRSHQIFIAFSHLNKWNESLAHWKEKHNPESGNKFAFSPAVTVFVCWGRVFRFQSRPQERNGGEITLISEWKQAQNHGKGRIFPFSISTLLEKSTKLCKNDPTTSKCQRLDFFDHEQLLSKGGTSSISCKFSHGFLSNVTLVQY